MQILAYYANHWSDNQSIKALRVFRLDLYKIGVDYNILAYIGIDWHANLR